MRDLALVGPSPGGTAAVVARSTAPRSVRARDKQPLVRPGSAHGTRLHATDAQVHAAVLAFLDGHLRS